ncbi:BRO-N domain-containing protein [Bacillus gobiensis]|uniref:BRO-N domain-containing protein n=1 Tax=Bacillus gobiensis TaxID=1441095 RepID=UPI003D242B87
MFLAKDVAEWIEYSKTGQGYYDVARMLGTIDEEEKIKATSTNNFRSSWFLTEDGLYEVLMQSRKPIAKQFKKQVKQILKSIRQDGGYIVANQEDDDETIMARALLVAPPLESASLAQKTIDRKNMLIEVNNPKIAAVKFFFSKVHYPSPLKGSAFNTFTETAKNRNENPIL